MGKRSKGKRPSKGQTVTSKKTKRPSAVVMWEDGTENLVFCHQLEAVDGASLPLAVGMRVKHFWRPEKIVKKCKLGRLSHDGLVVIEIYL